MGKRLTVSNVLDAVPPFQGREEVVRKSGHTANQIVNEVLNAHVEFASDYDDLVDQISFSRSEALEKQLFDFCKKNLHYVVEEGFYQSTRSPAGIVLLGSDQGIGVDCKHYSGFIAGVLDAVNRSKGKRVYDWAYRFASYDNNPEPGHVFVIVHANNGIIWIDPVLNFYDQKFPRPHYYRDKTIDMPLVRLSGIGKVNKVGCDCDKKRLGSTSSTGATIMSVAPVLAVIPVVGWIAAGAGEVVGAALEIFGSKYNDSTNERWLIQLYQFYVLGQGSVTSDNKVNESYGTAGLAWFATVMGVPVVDNVTFDLLKGYVNNKPTTQTYEERAKNYLANTKVNTYNIPLAQAIQAAQIADTLPYNNKAGSWAGALAAPTIAVDASGNLLPSSGYAIVGGSLVSTASGSPAGLPGASTGNPLADAWGWAQANPVPAIGIGIGVVIVGYLIFKPKKKR